MTLAIRLVAMIIGLQWAVTGFGQPAEAQVKPLLEEARALERADEFAKALSLRESALTIQLAIPGVALSEEVNLNLFFMGRNARLLDRKDTGNKPIAGLQSPDRVGLISTCRKYCCANEEKMQEVSESALTVLHTSLFGLG